MGGIAESDSAYCNTRYRSVVCSSVRVFVVWRTRAPCYIRWTEWVNEMPLGMDSRVVQNNTVLDRGPVCTHGKGRFGGRNLQFAAMPHIAKLLWLLCMLRTLVSGTK